MIRINLLPFRAARTKENIRRQVSIFLLSLVLLVVVMLAFNGYLGGKVEALESKLAGIKEDIKRYEEKARQVEAFKKQLEELNKKIGIVNQLKAHRKEPPQLLAEITELVVPGRMRLTNFSYSGGNNTISMNGVALDNETVAVFMKRLERSDKILEVTLGSAKQTTEFNVELKQFGITCKLADQKGSEKAKS